MSAEQAVKGHTILHATHKVVRVLSKLWRVAQSCVGMQTPSQVANKRWRVAQCCTGDPQGCTDADQIVRTKLHRAPKVVCVLSKLWRVAQSCVGCTCLHRYRASYGGLKKPVQGPTRRCRS